MDNREIYKYRFDELLKLFRRNRADIQTGREEKSGEYLIDISGVAFRQYSRMVDNNESWVIYTVEQMTRNLLQAYGIEYEIPKYEQAKPNGRKVYVCPFAFVKEEAGKRIGYIFRYKQTKGLVDMHIGLESFSSIDGIKYFFITDEQGKNIEMLNHIEAEKYSNFIHFATISEFFCAEFGEEEYDTFNEYAFRFNKEARELMGVTMLEMPTGNAVEEFRKEREQKLVEFDYTNLLPEKISEKQREVIRNNFFEKNRYLLMTIGSERCSFADSFISSEWYYNQSTTAGALEQTAIVVGYLKSVEQLLYTMIRFWINKNIWIKINGKYENSLKDILQKNGLIDFDEKYEEYIDKTLGALIRFVKLKKNDGSFKNRIMFAVDENTIQCVIDVLYNFKDYERNDRLHQHNLYTREDVEKIRNQAFLLYFLLLGSFNVSDEYVRNLGLVEKSGNLQVIKTEILEGKISEWSAPIVKYDIPKDASIIAFSINKFKKEQWSLNIMALDHTDKEKYDTIEWNHKPLYSSSITNNCLTWESGEDWTAGLKRIEEILNRLLAGKSEMASELKRYPEVVLGDMQVCCVLYKDRKIS